MSVDAALRDRLRTFADVLIPAAHGMPAASEIGVAAASPQVIGWAHSGKF